MDIGTILGIGIAFGCLMAGLFMEGGNPASYIAPSAFLIVIPSTVGVALAGGLIKDIQPIIKGTILAFTAKIHDGGEAIELMVKFAEKARREGLLALEEAVKDVDDPFMKKGVEMAVDGTDPEQLREILEAEIYAKKQADKIASKFYGDQAGLAPTLGVLGTVLGLVVVLGHLSDPASLGPHIATAFLATLYGVGSANVIYMPIMKKLQRISEIECHHMEVVVEGVIAIQAGSNPRVIQQKLTAIMGHAPANEDAKAA